MSKSILCDETNKKCFICGKQGNLDVHHCCSGTANRKNSEAYGLKIYLCRECHTMVHNKREIEIQIKQFAQRRWEEEYGTREDFIKVFGKSWILED